MKVLLYKGALKLVSKSGIGEAIRHQQQVLEIMGVDYTSTPGEAYDVIHLNTVLPDSFFMGLWAKMRGKKIVYYGHSTKEDFKNSFVGSNLLAPLFKIWLKACYNLGDIIITPTDYAKSLLTSYNLRPEIYSLSNGIDTEFFDRDEEGQVQFRESQGLSKEDKVVISVGHFIERKGITDFVELAKRMPDHHFFWFGYTNKKMIPKAVREAVETNLPNLHFPGYVDKETLRAAYRESDLFVFLTHEETEGIVLLEALSMKIPVLIRDIPIYEKWLKENEAVYKGRKIQEFEDHIHQICATGGTRALTEEAYRLVLGRSLGNVAKELNAIYGAVNRIHREA